MTTTYPSPRHIQEMCNNLRTQTSSNPPILETYDASTSQLIERRRFPNMLQLATHILFIAQMQLDTSISSSVQEILESWVLAGKLCPKQFIYNTKTLFERLGYKFRVMQWAASEWEVQRVEHAATIAEIEGTGNPLDAILDGTRITNVSYTAFTPWTPTPLAPIPPAPSPPAHPKRPYHPRPDYDCIGCPLCTFTTKSRSELNRHETSHWDPAPCLCPPTQKFQRDSGCGCEKCWCGVLRSGCDEGVGRHVRTFHGEQECGVGKGWANWCIVAGGLLDECVGVEELLKSDGCYQVAMDPPMVVESDVPMFTTREWC